MNAVDLNMRTGNHAAQNTCRWKPVNDYAFAINCGGYAGFKKFVSAGRVKRCPICLRTLHVAGGPA